MQKIYSVTSDEGNTNSDQEPVANKKINIPPPPSFLQNLTQNIVKLNESNENNLESNEMNNILQQNSPIPDKTDNSQSTKEGPSEVVETVEIPHTNSNNENSNINIPAISQTEENRQTITLESMQNNENVNRSSFNQIEPPPPIINSLNENQTFDSSDEIPMANNYNNDDYSNTELLFELYTTKIKSLLQKKFIVLNSIDSRVKELEKREIELKELDELKEKVEVQQNMILKLTEELQSEKEERMKLENQFEELKQNLLNNNNEIKTQQQQHQEQEELYPSNSNNSNNNNNNNSNFYSTLKTQWVKYYDDGIPYYYNVVNNKSMWEVPTEGFMEEWTYNSLYEEYNNNNNNNKIDIDAQQYYYSNNNNQQYQSEEEINKKAERVKEVWTEFFTNALQTKMKQKLQQSPPPVEHRQLPTNGIEEPLLQSSYKPTTATIAAEQNYQEESYTTEKEVEKKEKDKEGNEEEIEDKIEKETKDVYHHQYTSNYDKSSSMIMAIEKGDVNTVNKLLSINPNPDIPDSKQRYPLYMAVNNSQLEIVKILVNAGANIDRRCINGRSPLHVAVGNNDYNITSYLLSIGADVNVTDNNKDTPLHLAAISGNFEITKLLIRKGADPMKSNKLGLTPFECAAQTINLYKEVPQSLYDTIDLLKERTPDKYDTDNESLNTSDEESDSSPVQTQKQSKWFSFW